MSGNQQSGGIPIMLLDGPMAGIVIHIGERMILRQPVTETVVHWYDNDGYFIETDHPQLDKA